MKPFSDPLHRKILSVLGIGIVVMLFYAPLYDDFMQSAALKMSAVSAISESEKADLDTIMRNPDGTAITEAINRLMARPDIARVHVLKGEYEYPSFEITLGKNSRPGEIQRYVNHNEKGFDVSIGYGAKPVAAPGETREISPIIRSIALTLGLCLVFMPIMTITSAYSKADKPIEERIPPPPAPPSPPESKKPEPLPAESEPVRESLRLVKGDD